MIDTIRIRISDPSFVDNFLNCDNALLEGTVRACVDVSKLRASLHDSFSLNIEEPNFLETLSEYGLSLDTMNWYSYNVGSWCRNIVFAHNTLDSYVDVEFSLCKYLFGLNIYNYDSQTAKYAVFEFLSELYCYFSIPFPSTMNYFSLQRLDISWNYKINRIYGYEIMKYIKDFSRLRRKRVYSYSSSVMLVGRAYSLKMYDKHEEFLKHDYKSFIKSSAAVAQRMCVEHEKVLSHIDKACDDSKDLFRLEITLRKSKLLYNYIKSTCNDECKKVPLTWLLDLDLCGLFVDVLSDFEILELNTMNNSKIVNLLCNDTDLVAFAMTLKTLGYEETKALFSPRTFQRRMKALKDVGITKMNINSDVNFSFNVDEKKIKKPLLRIA